MSKPNNVTRGVAAAGLLAAFAQLAVAQPAYAEDQAPQPQQGQESSQVQQPQPEQDGLIGLMIEFYDRLFDSQNN
ncbi:MAG TPA: hypothetical protein VFA20_12390 [Myxococcaceae bacterium]|nr:hypothetical protein [Myxococcaceae bacterium]